MSKLLTLYNVVKETRKNGSLKGMARLTITSEGETLFEMSKEMSEHPMALHIHHGKMKAFHMHPKGCCHDEKDIEKLEQRLKALGFNEDDIKKMRAIHQGHKQEKHQWHKLSHMMTMIKLLDEMNLTEEGDLQALTLRLTENNLPEPIQEMVDSCCANEEELKEILNKWIAIIGEKDFDQLIELFKEDWEVEKITPEHKAQMRDKFNYMKNIVSELKRLGISPMDLDPEYLELKCLVDHQYKIKSLSLKTRLVLPNQKAFDFTLEHLPL